VSAKVGATHSDRKLPFENKLRFDFGRLESGGKPARQLRNALLRCLRRREYSKPKISIDAFEPKFSKSWYVGQRVNSAFRRSSQSTQFASL